jgi:AcrR family transcriptional regulator
VTKITSFYRHVLTGDQRAILDLLERNTPARYAYNLMSVAKIAAAVGCTTRTVKAAFRRFRDLGIVERVRGAAVRALRAIHGWRAGIRWATALLWRAPREGENSAPTKGKIPPPPVAPPLEPPNRSELKNDDELRPSPPSPAPDPGKQTAPEAPPAPPELLEAAAAAYGDSPVVAAKVREAAAEYPASWVAAAIGIAAAKAKRWGYVRGILGNFARQGGPEPAPIPQAARRTAAEIADEERRERRERLAKMRAGPQDDPPPTPEDVALAREWVATGHGVQRRIGERILARAHVEFSQDPNKTPI